MTTPGDPSEQPTQYGAPPPGAYEPPPIEQSQGQPWQQPQQPQPQGYTPPTGYPPPSYNQPGGSPQGGYPPPAYPGQQGYPSPPQYGGTPGYSQPAPYGGSAYTGYHQSAETNQLAIWSLVASLIGIICGIGSIAGIVLGIVALNQIKQNPQGGRGLAIAGIIVGAVSLAISFLWYVYAFSR